ncbi:hypothetical protein [Pseudomonas shirazensis]
MKAILSELMQWDIIENNPANGIKSLKVGEITAFTPATDDEVKLIKEKITSDLSINTLTYCSDRCLSSSENPIA